MNTCLHNLELNEWMGELDRRYRSNLDAASTSTPSKIRKVGAPVKSRTPCGAPSWSVDSSWRVTQPSDRKFDYRFNSS